MLEWLVLSGGGSEAGIEMAGGEAGVGMNGWCWLGWLMLELALRCWQGVLAVGEQLGWLALAWH